MEVRPNRQFVQIGSFSCLKIMEFNLRQQNQVLRQQLQNKDNEIKLIIQENDLLLQRCLTQVSHPIKEDQTKFTRKRKAEDDIQVSKYITRLELE